MTAKELVSIINVIPQYVCYIYPGYISLYLYYYLHSLTLDESKAKLVKSVAISYLYIIVLKEVTEQINLIAFIEVKNDISGVGFNVFLIFVSVVIPYILYMMEKKCKILGRVKRKFGISTSFAKNEIEVLQKQYSDTIWIYVYMKDNNIMYEGSLTEKEMEESRTRFFCLSKYRKYLLKENGKKKKLADYSDDEKEKVLIYFDMISHFEIANVDKEE